MTSFLTVLAWVFGVLSALYIATGFTTVFMTYGRDLTRAGKVEMFGIVLRKVMPAIIVLIACLCWILALAYLGGGAR